MIARRSCREMREFAETDGVEWTMAHAYLANLGAFKFKVKGEPLFDDVLGPPGNSRSTVSLVSLERVYETIHERHLATMPEKNDSEACKDTEILENRGAVVDNGKGRSPSKHSSITGTQGVNGLEVDSILGSKRRHPLPFHPTRRTRMLILAQ
jgi:hypothetical protein